MNNEGNASFRIAIVGDCLHIFAEAVHFIPG